MTMISDMSNMNTSKLLEAVREIVEGGPAEVKP